MSGFDLARDKAIALMQDLTGEEWPIQRLVRAGARVAVWLDCPPGATPEVLGEVFQYSEAGIVAEIVEGGDLQRLAFTQGNGTLSIARRQDGTLIRMRPPASFDADAIKFDEEDLRALASRFKPGDRPDGQADLSTRDYSMLAQPAKLIAAFGPFTDMKQEWFVKLNDIPGLKAARQDPGRGGRNIQLPWFCPFEVLKWLLNPRRKKGRKLQVETGWRVLKNHFPKVHTAHVLDAPDGVSPG